MWGDSFLDVVRTQVVWDKCTDTLHQVSSDPDYRIRRLGNQGWARSG